LIYEISGLSEFRVCSNIFRSRAIQEIVKPVFWPISRIKDQWLKFDTDKYTTKYSWDLQQKNMASEGASGVSVLGDSTCDNKVDFRDFADLAGCWLVGIE
jgi:hypothetical protein